MPRRARPYTSVQMQPQTRSTFRQRLGYYAFGLAIGFVMLGLLWSGKDVATTPAPAPSTDAAERVTPDWAKPPHAHAPPAPGTRGTEPQTTAAQPPK